MSADPAGTVPQGPNNIFIKKILINNLQIKLCITEGTAATFETGKA